MIVVLITLFVLSSIWALGSVRVVNIFQNPLFFPIVFWGLGYPIRYLFLVTDPAFFSETQILNQVGLYGIYAGIIFASLFVAVVGLGMRIMLSVKFRQISSLNIIQFKFNEECHKVVHFAFIIYIVAFIYQAASVGIGGLYEDFEQLKMGLGVAIIGELISLKWFVATLCAVAYQKTGFRSFFVELIMVVCTLAYTALITTSKGQILNLLIYGLVLFPLFGRKPPYKLIFILSFLGILFSVISYQIREISYFAVRNSGTPLDILVSYQDINLNFDQIFFLLEKNLITVIDRVTYYGDALASMITVPVKSESPYMFGSIVEFGNFIPTFIWESRPHLSFNHHVTGSVWGLNGLLSETPIGRVGESFYVAGWFGIFFGFLYAAIFSLMCVFWHKAKKSILGVALWVSIYMAWLLPDAYLVYGIKQVVFVLFFAVFLNLLRRLRFV